MSQLGIAPLILVAGGAAGTGAFYLTGEALQESYDRGRINSLLQWMGIKNTPSIPQSPSPAFGPPPAPQTAGKMETWTPDDLWEVTVQRSQQYAKDMDFVRTAGAKQPLVSPLPGDRTADNSRFWLLAGLGVVAVVLLVRR